MILFVSGHAGDEKNMWTLFTQWIKNKWGKVFKSGLSKFLKDRLSQKLLSPLLKFTLAQIKSTSVSIVRKIGWETSKKITLFKACFKV